MKTSFVHLTPLATCKLKCQATSRAHSDTPTLFFGVHCMLQQRQHEGKERVLQIRCLQDTLQESEVCWSLTLTVTLGKCAPIRGLLQG